MAKQWLRVFFGHGVRGLAVAQDITWLFKFHCRAALKGMRKYFNGGKFTDGMQLKVALKTH